jgi:predicted dehydrogenase
MVAVVDRDVTRAQAAAQRFDVGSYTDVRELLSSVRPELVSLCTPDPTHAELLELILETPGVRGVLAEKPLADSAASAASLGRLARDRGVVLSINYSRRFAPSITRLARAIAAGELGELQHVHGIYTGGLRHNGTHWLDLLRMLAGEPVAARGWDRLRERGTDPSLDAELLFDGGAGARLAALDAERFTAFEFELTGTAGRVRLASAGHRIERWGVGADELHPSYRVLVSSLADESALRDMTGHAVTDLVRCVLDGGRPACGAEEATRALLLAEAIAASARTGGGKVPVVTG